MYKINQEQFAKLPDELKALYVKLPNPSSEEVRECFPETTVGARKAGQLRHTKDCDLNFTGNTYTLNDYPANSGNASRFFKSIKKDFEYSQKYAILKLCENNISVNNAENNLKTTSQIELVANIFSALKSVTPNLDLLNQNLNALFVEKSVKNTSIDFVAKCVAIKEIPEELVNQQDYIVFRDFMEDYKKCSQTQNPVSVEKWGNIDITQIMISLLKLCGYVLPAINENTHLENQEERQCEYKSLIYKAKASKSERNRGCEELPEVEATKFDGGDFERGNGNNAKEQKLRNFHPTVKPIALMEYLIKMVTPKGGIVLDPFAGSGSTLVAAKKNGYNYIGIEKEEEYINIINKRLENIK